MDTNNQYGCLEIQKDLLPLIKEFDKFCKEKGIRYSLDGGSLLGAIRHQGFIPWDDDLDVYMDRSNYEKFRNNIHCNSKLSMEVFNMSALWTPRVRFCGNHHYTGFKPTMDIFIKDFVPRNPIVSKMKHVAILGCQGMIKNNLQLKKGNFFLKICSLITFLVGRLFTENFKFKMYDRISQIGNPNKATKVASYNTMWNYIKYQFDKKVLDNFIKVPFEDTELYVTSEYHHYLTVLFGNYMQPPKMEHRLAKHMNNAFDIADMYINDGSITE